MNAPKRPQKAFLTVTLLTVVAITTVFMVYAALLATYTGSNVVISSMGGQIEYSLTKNPGSWGTASISQGEGSEWYSRIHMTSPPSQTVTVEWTLQMQNGGSWASPPTNVTQFTSPSISLSPSTTDIFAFQSGSNTIDNNYNWGSSTIAAGTYRILTQVNTV